MQLELPIRWTETNKEEQKKEELIHGEFAEPKITYSYSRLLIDSSDIGPYYDLDANNTMINDKLGKVYCVTIPLDEFKKIYTEITGKAIMSIQVKREIIKPPKDDKKKKNDNDNDILL